MQLTDRHYRMLELLVTYGLAVPEVYQRLLDLESENAVVKVCSRLVGAGYLRRYQLYHRRPYFRVGPATCRLYGLDHRLMRPLGGTALAGRFAVLSYCMLGETRREPLGRAQLKGRFETSLAVYRTEPGRLGCIKVDYGASPARIVGACSKLSESLDVDEIAVLTATAEKAEAVSKAYTRERLSFPLRLGVIPELMHLLTKVR